MKKGIKKIFGILAMFFMSVTLVAGCGDKEIVSLTVKEGTLERVYMQHSDVSDAFDDLKVIVKYNDGTQEEVGKDKLTIGAFSTAEVKKHKVEIAFGDEKFEVELTVTNNIDEVYEISGFELPASIMTHYNNKAEKGKNLTEGSEEYIASKEAEFYDLDNEYVVGDDNKFRFFPNITVVDDDNNPVEINSYKSVTEVYLKENGNYRLLNDTELEAYVEVSETKSTFDFTEEAVDENFKIVVRPYYLADWQLEEENIGDYTVAFEFKVVDGYNVTNAVELGVLNNDTEDELYDEWTTVLNRAGIQRSTALNSIKGIVLHDNIKVTTNDIPSEIVSGSKIVDKYENAWTDIYDHINTTGKFNFYGNYFTVDASELPVSNVDYHNSETSHTTLFKFRASGTLTDAEAQATKTMIENVSLIGNAPRTNNEEDPKELGGLIAFKLGRHSIEVDNVITKTFLINTMLEYEKTYVNVNHMKSYDAYQNSIFLWMGHLNVTNSDFARAGGPLMILQQPWDKDDTAEEIAEEIPYVTVDDSTKTRLESLVTGKEAWFKVMGADGMVGQILAFSSLLENSAKVYDENKVAYFAKNISGKQNETILGMNIISVNMNAADGVDALADAVHAQGKLTIGGQVIVDKMSDTMTTLKSTIQTVLTGAFMSQGMDTKEATSTAEKTVNNAPIIRSSAGGIGIILPNGNSYQILNINAMIAQAKKADQLTILSEYNKLFEGDYLDFHYLGMDILLEYFH